jgi:hypothetical protein
MLTLREITVARLVLGENDGSSSDECVDLSSVYGLSRSVKCESVVPVTCMLSCRKMCQVDPVVDPVQSL